MNRISAVVKNLLIINVLIFLGTMGLPDQIKAMGMLYFPKSDFFEPYQFVSSMFMHADFGHLAFNMISLFFLGSYVERVMGAQRFLIFYLICGFAASLLHLGVNAYEFYAIVNDLKSQGLINSNTDLMMIRPLRHILTIPVLGASGAIYGVMIAFATIFPNLKLMVFPLPIPIKAKYLGIGLVAIGIFNGVGNFQQGIAHFAHVGGAIMGFVMVKYWKYSSLQ